MYNIFYIYNYKYTRPSNTLTLSRPKCPYKPRPHKQPYQSHQQAQAAIYIYRAKFTIHIMHQAIWSGYLHICGDSEKLYNAFCVSIMSLFCNHIENIL